MTTLYSFCAQANCADGRSLTPGWCEATDGNFYGTTLEGGANTGCSLGSGSCGTVFKITPGGRADHAVQLLRSTGCADGGNPYAGLVQASDGNFYGTTFGRGANGYGTVFKITPAGALTSLYSFCSQQNCADGAIPSPGWCKPATGTSTGQPPRAAAAPTTRRHGLQNHPSGTLTTLYNFCSQPACADGALPTRRWCKATDGNFYGTTIGGGANCNRTAAVARSSKSPQAAR